MKVIDIITMNKSGAMFRVIDASKQGYMTSPKVIIEASYSAIKERFGECELIGFDAIGKNKVALYIIPRDK